MNKGYYWVWMVDSDEWTIGFFDGNAEDQYPWMVVGSDGIFKTKEIQEVGAYLGNKPND